MMNTRETSQKEKVMIVLCYKKCSTCHKALKWLESRNISYEERAIVENHPTYEELKEWYERSGLPLRKFFNTSGDRKSVV